jgi:hypothetical protein
MQRLLISVFALVALTFTVAIVAQDLAEPVTPVTPVTLATAQATGEERLVIETKDKKESPAVKNLKIETVYRPRLPNGYGPAGANVDASQRERILKFLTDYNEVIAMLKLRVELLEKERDVKIEAVLTPDQKQLLPRSRAGAQVQPNQE